MNRSGKLSIKQRQIAVPPAVLVAEDRDRLVAQRLDHAGDELQGPMRKGRPLRIAAVDRVVELAGKDGDALQIDQPHAGLGQRLAQAGAKPIDFRRIEVSRRRQRIPAVAEGLAARSGVGARQQFPNVAADGRPLIDQAPSGPKSAFEQLQSLARLIEQLRVGDGDPLAGGLRRACGRRRDHGLQPLVEFIAADSFRHFPDAGRDDQRPQVRPVARFVSTEEERHGGAGVIEVME